MIYEKHFNSEYEIMANGVIRQRVITKQIQYDKDYVLTNYVKNISELVSQNMAFLRLGNVVSSIGHIPKSILDVGYGSGSFLNVATEIITDVNGYDVPPIFPICNPNVKIQNSMFDRDYEVITFFDSLEHFPNIYEIEKAKCRYMYISCPWCHFEENKNYELFYKWKHRKPDEHLYHFGIKSLCAFMKEIGFEYISHSNIEDCIRRTNLSEENILSACFKKI